MVNYGWYNGYSYPYTWRQAYPHHEYGQAGYARPPYSDQNGRGVHPRLDTSAWSNWQTQRWGDTLDYGNWPHGAPYTRRAHGAVDSSALRARRDWVLSRY
jgi:hypothetical protein